MEPNFIPASKESIPKILEMMADFYALEGYLFDFETTKLNLHKFIADVNLGKLWLLILEEEIIGYIVMAFGFSFEYGGRDALIDEFFISEEYRDKGIGAKSIEFVTQQAKMLGVNTLHLEVERRNKRGTSLYVKQGFRDNKRLLMNKCLSDWVFSLSK